MLRRIPENELTVKPADRLDVELTSLATAVPSHGYSQKEAHALAQQMFPEFEHLEGVFANTGIEQRYSCVPLEWFSEPHNWVDRNAVYEEAALDLLERAARDAMEKAAALPREIGAIVTVSTTGLSVPSLDAKLLHRLGLDPTTERLPVFGLGCAGGVSGMARAARLAMTFDGQYVLMLCVELCGLNFRRSDVNKVNYISSALFGDGAAALLVRSDDGDGHNGQGIGQILAVGEHNWPDTLDMMGWSIEQDGFGVVMSTQIPQFARNGLQAAAEAFLSRHGYRFEDLAGLVSHPGGRKVLEAIAGALDIEDGALAHSRDVLRDYGNMSSPTVLFVLDRTVGARHEGPHLMVAFGPGFTVSFALIDLSRT
ncbi:MAG: type III polyketide synthase [Hyphomicrobiaceae bacterium]|nr:type III polyketide synthase [Hyphomicrobiaceae bacterium]